MTDLLMFLGFDDRRTDGRTDGQTTLVDKSLSRLKTQFPSMNLKTSLHTNYHPKDVVVFGNGLGTY